MKKDDDDKNQDPDEKSGWKNSEIEILLDYLQENFRSWSKGNKTKFYNDMAKNILPNKEAIAIKSKFFILLLYKQISNLLIILLIIYLR